MHILNIFAAEEEAGGISALGLDPLAILAQAITFLLLFWLLKKFALTKIVDTLEKRRKTIDEGVELGLKMAEEQEKLNAKIEEKLAQARVEADKIIAAGNQEAGELIREAEAKASVKFEAMLADAQGHIEEDVKKAKLALEQELLELVARATELVIDERLTTEKDSQLIKRSLEKVGR